jgi:type II secretory pathway pseudopilin PulG
LNARQKELVANIVIVIVFTVAMVTGFANIKNAINRSEAMRAMELLGNEILAHRKTYGSLPSEYQIKQFVDAIGAVRLTDVHYRGQWIEFGSVPDTTILAYSQKNYRGFVKAGYIVLWLNGKVEWINKKPFEKILATQQELQELQWIKEHL